MRRILVAETDLLVGRVLHHLVRPQNLSRLQLVIFENQRNICPSVSQIMRHVGSWSVFFVHFLRRKGTNFVERHIASQVIDQLFGPLRRQVARCEKQEDKQDRFRVLFAQSRTSPQGQLQPILAVPAEGPQLKVKRSVKDVSAETPDANVSSFG
jgi:hypothetical protein